LQHGDGTAKIKGDSFDDRGRDYEHFIHDGRKSQGAFANDIVKDVKRVLVEIHEEGDKGTSHSTT